MTKPRRDQDLPEAIVSWGWRYHHLGIPTTMQMAGEVYLPHFKFYVTGFKTSPFGIEWMRFENDSPINKLIQTIPHLAFLVDDIEYELAYHNLKVITKTNTPSEGIKVAMVEHNGAPIELIEFEKHE